MSQSQQPNPHQHVQYPQPSNTQYIPNQVDPATYQQQPPQQTQYQQNIQYQQQTQAQPNHAQSQSHSGYPPQASQSHSQHHSHSGYTSQPSQSQQAQVQSQQQQHQHYSHGAHQATSQPQTQPQQQRQQHPHYQPSSHSHRSQFPPPSQQYHHQPQQQAQSQHHPPPPSYNNGSQQKQNGSGQHHNNGHHHHHSHHQSSKSTTSQSHHSSSRSHKKKSSRRMLKTRVFASGYNYNYQFGLAKNDNEPEIKELEWCQGKNISYICAGIQHLCYLSFTGNYYFCGQIDREKLGIVGNQTLNPNDFDNNINDKIITKSQSPLSSFMDHDNIRISRIADGTSSRHVIIISKDFKAYSMGSNQKGQLGLNHFKSTLKFTEIIFPKSRSDIENYVEFDVIDASCGESHSAFVVMPKCTLPIDKILNYYYFQFQLKPPTQRDVSKIIIKYIIKSSSLLSEPRGRLYVCGCNSYGQLGIGSSSSSSSSSDKGDNKSKPTQMCVNKPIQVTATNIASVSIAQVSCGENHTICLDNRGRVYCFGDNYYGQSGAHTNHYENVYYPLKIEHFKTTYSARIVKVSSGKYHCVALDKTGRVFCWGLGAYGQLGCDKLNKRIILPILVSNALSDKKIIDVRCGVYHTIALTNKRQLYCWGANNYGQCFQNVNQENIIVPKLAKIDDKLLSKQQQIYKVFCGYYSTLILTTDIQ